MAEPAGERLARLEQRVVSVEGDLHAIQKDVRDIRDALLAGKGGWKVAASLFGLAAAVLASVMTAGMLKWIGLGK